MRIQVARECADITRKRTVRLAIYDKIDPGTPLQFVGPELPVDPELIRSACRAFGERDSEQHGFGVAAFELHSSGDG